MERHYDSINFTKEDKNNLDFCKITRVDKRKSEVKEYFKPYKLMFLFLSLVFLILILITKTIFYSVIPFILLIILYFLLSSKFKCVHVVVFDKLAVEHEKVYVSDGKTSGEMKFYPIIANNKGYETKFYVSEKVYNRVNTGDELTLVYSDGNYVNVR